MRQSHDGGAIRFVKIKAVQLMGIKARADWLRARCNMMIAWDATDIRWNVSSMEGYNAPL